MLLPCCQDQRKIASDQLAYSVEFVTAKPVVALKSHWLEPEFAVMSIALDLHVHRFVAIEAKEEEAIGTRNTADGGHESVLPT